MNHAVRRTAAVATLLQFGTIAVLPRLTRADERGRPTSAPIAQYVPQQPPPPPSQEQRPMEQQPAPAGPYGPMYQPPVMPPPVRMKTVERPQLGLIIAGATVFGAVWLPTAFVGYVINQPAEIAPVIGPLFGWNNRDQAQARAENAGLVFVTLAQTTGLALLIAGLASRKKVLVQDTSVTFVPSLLPGGGGLAAAGAF